MFISGVDNSYNINTKGYVNDRQILTRAVKQAKFCYKNATTEINQAKYKEAQTALKNFLKQNPLKTILYNIANFYKVLLEYDINIFLHKQTWQEPKEIKKLRAEKIKKINTAKYNYEGKIYSNHELAFKYSKEKDLDKKAKLRSFIINVGKKYENDLKELIIKSNEYAKTKGYKTYYQYLLKKRFKTSEEELFVLINEYMVKNNIKALLLKKAELLAKHYNTTPEELKPHQYHNLTDFCNIDKYFDSPEKIINMAKKTYESMGFDLKRREEKNQIYYDLDNNSDKNIVYCQNLGFKEVGVCSITNKDLHSFNYLLHELGHAVFYLNSSDLLSRYYKSPSKEITEGVALMMESLTFKENLLEDIVPQSVLQQYKEFAEIDHLTNLVHCIESIEFEKEIYDNPNQDFEKLINKIHKKYSDINSEKNAWYNGQYFTNPAYIQNYLRGEIYSDKIYSAARKKLGTELHKNPKTAKFLTNRVFNFGGLLNNKILDFTLKL